MQFNPFAAQLSTRPQPGGSPPIVPGQYTMPGQQTGAPLPPMQPPTYGAPGGPMPPMQNQANDVAAQLQQLQGNQSVRQLGQPMIRSNQKPMLQQPVDGEISRRRRYGQALMRRKPQAPPSLGGMMGFGQPQNPTYTGAPSQPVSPF